MIRIFLTFIIFITLINQSVASFPLTQSYQIETVEGITSNINQSTKNYWIIYALLSLFLFILAALFLAIMYFGMITWSISGPMIAQLIAYSIYSAIAATLLGVVAFIGFVTRK